MHWWFEVLDCFYHVTQSTWQNIQDLDFTCYNNENGEFKHFCGVLDGLAFLPPDEVSNSMAYIWNNAVPNSEALLDYFDAMYVSGAFRYIQHTKCWWWHPTTDEILLPTSSIFSTTLQCVWSNHRAWRENQHLQGMESRIHPTCWSSPPFRI